MMMIFAVPAHRRVVGKLNPGHNIQRTVRGKNYPYKFGMRYIGPTHNIIEKVKK